MAVPHPGSLLARAKDAAGGRVRRHPATSLSTFWTTSRRTVTTHSLNQCVGELTNQVIDARIVGFEATWRKSYAVRASTTCRVLSANGLEGAQG
jgi:hypothetical protein